MNLILITGFLGSGKTTLILGIVRAARLAAAHAGQVSLEDANGIDQQPFPNAGERPHHSHPPTWSAWPNSKEA